MRPAITRAASVLATIGLIVVSFARVGAAATGPHGGSSPQCMAAVRSGGGAVPARPASQGHRDARTNARFAFSVTSDGGVRMTVKAGDLDADKTVYADGRYRLVLRAGDDVVSVVGFPGAVEIERRNQRGHRVEVGQATDDDWLRVKTLLAGSKAVRLFRTLACSLDAETLQTPAGPAVLTSDAVVGVLDGDVGAIRRLADKMRAEHKAKIRPAALLRQEFLECYRKYSDAVVAAWNDYAACTISFYPFDPRQYLCDLAWILMAESAWFQFISCSAFPWID